MGNSHFVTTCRGSDTIMASPVLIDTLPNFALILSIAAIKSACLFFLVLHAKRSAWDWGADNFSQTRRIWRMRTLLVHALSRRREHFLNMIISLYVEGVIFSFELFCIPSE